MIAILAWLLFGQSACAQALSGSDAAELCLAEQSGHTIAEMQAAVDHARRAASLATKSEIRVRAIDLLAQLYDEKHLNLPSSEEPTLRELISLRPGELEPISRLAKLQERQGNFDAAEDTLLIAHRQKPDDEAPYRLLAQFYARRATALHRVAEAEKPRPVADTPQPDENGVYRVGGVIAAPKRVDSAVYPPEAREAGIQGVVILEVVIDETGGVSGTKVLRSIPLLDEPAMRATERWQFEPATLNGQPVKVKMTITQNFTLK
jgi:TonB family protein